MYEVARNPIPQGVEIIKISNVPGVMLENVKVIERKNVVGEVVIVAEDNMEPFGFSFTFQAVGNTLYAYLNHTKDPEDPGMLSGASFTVKVPKGRQTDVTVV